MSKTKTLELAEVQEICRRFKARCYLDVKVDTEGKATFYSWSFFGLNTAQVKQIRKELNLGTLKKDRSGSNIHWEVGNITFFDMAKCKIVGYKEEQIPAQTKKTPIYECE